MCISNVGIYMNQEHTTALNLHVVSYCESSEDICKCHTKEFKLVNLPSSQPPPQICVYADPQMDELISAQILQGGLYEDEQVGIFQQLLSLHAGMDVLDLGANLGLFTLPAAMMGRRVLAVEALPKHAHMLRASIRANNFQDKVTLLNNAISGVRAVVEFEPTPGNMGATFLAKIFPQHAQVQIGPTRVHSILMDDLLHATQFSQAIMKIDIESQEPEAFRHAEKLFSAVDIRYVLMEWDKMPITPVVFAERIGHIEAMIDFFFSRGYQVYTEQWEILERLYWREWPRNVIWARQKPVFPS